MFEVRIQEIKILPDILLIQNLIKAARLYSEYADKVVLIVFAKSKIGPFAAYEFWAGKENFQHLAGIKYPGGAEVFYNKCLTGTVDKKDIVPAENLKTTSSKIEVLPGTLDLKNAKIYKIGKKDAGTMKNKFSVGIGNMQSLMGLDRRGRILPIPVTVMNRKITDFCSEIFDVFLVMTKDRTDIKYRNILFEKTLSIVEKADFPREILTLIEFEADDIETDYSEEAACTKEKEV